jgi:membrane-associated phospholipid phosphatase
MTFARTGMAIADAFINCWKWKYVYFAERPNTFIPEHIDKNWESFWPDPPFPSFPSGHAFQAGAASAVWIEIFGKNVPVSDSAHFGRNRDELRNTDFVPRHFDSISQIASEIALSRFYGGIHTPQDNDAGLQHGKTIGENINKLNWRKQ